MVEARTCNCIGKRTQLVTARVGWWVRRLNVSGYSIAVEASLRASFPFGKVARSHARAAREKKLAARLAPHTGELASRLCWRQLVSLAPVFVALRNAPPFAVCWGEALSDETKTVALNPGHIRGRQVLSPLLHPWSDDRFIATVSLYSTDC